MYVVKASMLSTLFPSLGKSMRKEGSLSPLTHLAEEVRPVYSHLYQVGRHRKVIGNKSILIIWRNLIQTDFSHSWWEYEGQKLRIREV